MKASAGNRILMLLENQPYPRDRRVRREATALVAAGYRVTVICPSLPEQPLQETVDGVRVYRYWAPPPANGLLGYVWEYAYSTLAAFAISLRVFLDEGFDVIHAHNPPDTFVFVAAFYKLFGKRFIYDHHDLSPEMYNARLAHGGSRLVYRALAWLEVLSCRLADHVIATNESYKKVEMERDGVPAKRITVVRNWTDLHLRPPAEPALALRTMKKTIIGYVGVMGFQDGVDYLLRALHHLVRDLNRTDFYCVVIGTGAAWPGLRALARRLALDEFVWFTGLISDEDVLRYLSAADICVDPDPSNPFNDRSTMIKMMEYMALGKPIVAFDLPEHVFTADQAALYAAPNDELAFAHALAHLMDNPRRREAMGAFGRCRIETQLAGQFVVPKLLEAYEAVLPRPARPQTVHAHGGRTHAQHAPQPLAVAQEAACEPHDSA